MQTKVLIVGGGLSGLHTAYELQQLGIDYILIEARDRLGGRILSQSHHVNSAVFDLGPAWFWPGQFRMEQLLDQLSLKTEIFQQYSQGESVFEDNQANLQKGFIGISMAGSLRLQGGFKKMIDQIKSKISSENVLLNSNLEALNKTPDINVLATIRIKDKPQQIECQHVILALPPRLDASSITFNPSLKPDRLTELTGIPTWMAGHAKIVVLYEKPFWRTLGFSGDAISHLGPLREIHDASAEVDGSYALFGFVGTQPYHRLNREEELKSLTIAQLTRLFGNQAQKPIAILFKDWANDPLTSVNEAEPMTNEHLSHDLSSVLEDNWDNKIIWSGTETASYAQRNNGYLEGALEASKRTVSLLKKWYL